MKIIPLFEIWTAKDEADYRKWRRENVTYRGYSGYSPLRPNSDETGMIFTKFGAGLYSTPISNKSLIKSYGGKTAILVGAKPKKPLVFNSLNEAEIWVQQLMLKVIGVKSVEEWPDNFEEQFRAKTTIEDEVKKLGYDGIIVKGREMVLYDPQDKDVRWFEDERQLETYYDTLVRNQVS